MELVSMDNHKKESELKKEEEEKKEESSNEDIKDMFDFNDEKEKLNIEDNQKEKERGDVITKKDAKYYIKKTAKILINIGAFIGFYKCYKLYYSSLEGCNLGEDICSDKQKWIKLKVREEVDSSIIMAIFVQLMIFKILSKLHLIHVVVIFLIFYLYSHGYEFPDHGFFNFFYFWLLVTIYNILTAPFDIILFCIIKRVKKRFIIIYSLFLIITIISIYNYIVTGSKCDDWSKGLNNTYIENDINKYGCQIKNPKNCLYNILNNAQDYTRINGKNCKNYRKKNEKENLFKYSKSPYINEKSKIIGYPLTNKDPICYGDYLYNTEHLLRKYFYNNLVDMENEEILEKYYKDKMPEIQVEFSKKNEGKIKINLNYNKILSEQRKLLENKITPYSENIIIIYVDSVSRGNSIRQMKKTLQFFEKFISYKGGFNEKYPTENFHSFQFLKYYAFNRYTL